MVASLLTLTLAGCATPLPTRLPTQPRGRRYNISIDTLGVEASIAGPADSVWSRLPEVYASLGLQIQERDDRMRRLGVCAMRVRGRLSGTPLSRYLDCGDLRGVSNADRLEVELVVLTTVKDNPPSGVSVFTFVIGNAAESAGSSNRLWCTSNGGLEARIRDALTQAGG